MATALPMSLSVLRARLHAGYSYVVFGKETPWNPAGHIVLNTGAGNLIDGTHGIRFDGVTANDESGILLPPATSMATVMPMSLSEQLTRARRL